MQKKRSKAPASRPNTEDGDGQISFPLGAGSLPKDFMVPGVLLLLKQWSAHGYWLLQSLHQLGFGGLDHPTLYKELRSLQRQGLVTSEWQAGTSGPAKRMYTLTEAGEQFLRTWANAVAGYQRMFTSFFDLYSKVLEWPVKEEEPKEAAAAVNRTPRVSRRTKSK